MRKPRTNIFLLVTLFAAAGLGGLAWFSGKPSGGPTIMPTALGCVAPCGMAQSADQATGSSMGGSELRVQPVESLSADASVLVAAMCDLQLMAAATDLTLDSEQLSALAAVVVRAQAIRHTYEATIARVQVIAPGRYRAEIPVYACAGDALREQFSTDLRAELGETVAREVQAKLGERLEGRFAGFGVSVQTLDISADPAGQPDDVQIARTASYWNSVEGGDRLTTRREIHFPVLDDPTGGIWRALQAVMSGVRDEHG